MLPDEIETTDILRVLREMFASVRELNRRIDELQWVLKEEIHHEYPDQPPETIKIDALTDDGRSAIKTRIWRLIQTRFNIMHSIYDMRGKFIKAFLGCGIESEKKRMELERIFDREDFYQKLRKL